jgi:hypothetical protein
MRWDIFCTIIDNHGDLGVCWRLSAELAARGDAVRLWVDAPEALAWMAPGGREGVQVLHQAGHQLLQTRIRRLRQARDNGLGDGLLVQIAQKPVPAAGFFSRRDYRFSKPEEK